MRLRKLARYVSSWLNLGMDGTSFPLFPLLPAELQFNIWDQSIGPPRIHIFRPAPLDGAHWFQDYACPIHQVLDAGTNKQVEEHILERLAPARSCGGAHEFIWPKLVKADLSHFKPNAQTQRNISLLIHDEDRVDIAITLVKGARSSFRRVALLVHFLGWTLQHSQRILDYVEEIQDTIEEIVFEFIDIWDDVALLPESVGCSIEMNMNAIEAVLEDLDTHLEEYKSGFPLDERSIHEVLVDDMTALRRVSRRANRAGMACLEPDIIQEVQGNIDWRLPGGTVAAFNRDEERRATQRFIVAPDRDLIYVIDPRRSELFLQLWKSRWCKQVKRLALLVCDCWIEMEWLGTCLISREEQLRPDEPGVFDQTELKEIMLVARPKGRLCHGRPVDGLDFLDLPRDNYGFVDYAVVRDEEQLFGDENVDIVNENFDAYEAQLKMMLPKDLGREIKFSRVVDIDCEDIGMTNVKSKDNIYTRSRRQ
ncbi:hypothetical protein F4823DRAFT_561118 [Ustulina deusta]|nr:hypothetical protein F4823DRAFT_561118 [Ustulina deusta]